MNRALLNRVVSLETRLQAKEVELPDFLLDPLCDFLHEHLTKQEIDSLQAKLKDVAPLLPSHRAFKAFGVREMELLEQYFVITSEVPLAKRKGTIAISVG